MLSGYLPVTLVRGGAMLRGPPQCSMIKRMKTIEMKRSMLRTLYKQCASLECDTRCAMYKC